MTRKNLNQAHADMIIKRREMVSALRLKGLTLHQIRQALTEGTGKKDDNGNVLGRLVNPDTNEPFDVATIHEDLVQLKAEWAANAARSADEFISEDLAELNELKRAAWSKGKYDIVLRAMERRAKLLGLDKPEKRDLTSNGKELQGLTAERANALDRLAEEQLLEWDAARRSADSAASDADTQTGK